MKRNYLRIISITLSIVFSLALSNVLFAEDSKPKPRPLPPVKQERKDMKEDLKVKKDALKEDFKAKKEGMKTEFEDRKEEMKKEGFVEDLKAKRDALKEEFSIKKEGVKTEFETKREAIKKELETKREALKARFEDKKMDDDSKKIEGPLRVAFSFGTVAENLAKISDRINTRIQKLEEAGADVATSKELMVKAEESLSKAMGYISELKTIVDAKTEINIESARNSAKLAKESLKSSHEYMREALKALKEKVAETRKINPVEPSDNSDSVDSE